MNLQCRVLILTAHLKRKCQCATEDCIDLVDEAGALMNLNKVENPASEFASKYLRERQRYILVRVTSKFLSKAAQLSLWARTGLLQGWVALQGTAPHTSDTCHSLPAQMCLWTGSLSSSCLDTTQ